MLFEPDQALDAVVAGEARVLVGAMLVPARRRIGGDAGVQRAVSLDARM